MTFADRSAPRSATAPLRYAVVLAAMVLAGCTSAPPAPPVTSSPATVAGTSAASTTPSSTVATTTTSTAAPTTSVDTVLARIPAAARPKTEAGAAAFAKFYFETINGGFKSAQSRDVAHLSDASCTTCNSFTQAIDELRSRQQHYGGDLATVEYSTPVSFTKRSAQILVDLKQRQVPVLGADGGELEKTPAGSASFLVSVRFDERWVVTRIQKTKD
jgi:hypothetical protein